MYDIDLARKDELAQTFTPQDVEDIKSAIDVPRANVTILNTVYSPEETKIGVWREYRTVDNEQVLMEKPLYEKTIKPSLSNSSVVNISSLNCEFASLFEVKMRSKLNSPQVGIIPFLNGNSTMFFQFEWDSSRNLTGISTFNSNQYITDASYECYVTIRYTKTSDSWQEVTQ